MDASSTETFSRGSGPLVSVLLPTRGRAADLVECVNSFYTTAQDRSLIEILVKADEDDTETLSAACQLRDMGMVRLYQSARGNGYQDAALWYNGLAKEAKGDWLYWFNDDARMLTDGWDQILLHAPVLTPTAKYGIFAFATPNIANPRSQEFMFLRRNVFDILGHLTRLPFIDTWVWTIMCMLQSYTEIKIFVNHRRETQDQIAKDRDTRTPSLLGLLCTPGAISMKLADCQLLLGHWALQAIEDMRTDQDKAVLKTGTDERKACAALAESMGHPEIAKEILERLA